jgi:hypothetical protein
VEFCNTYDIIIKPSDKNAGLCVMRRSDYDNEIISQLSDENVYHPSTSLQYNLTMDTFISTVKYYSDFMPSELQIKKLYPIDYKPATFYVLSKVHKEFQTFPKGRPISSTKGTVNKCINMALDMFLQPLVTFIPEVIIDSTHLLILLKHLKLDPLKKYALVTVDIKSLYLELLVSDCKKFCCETFENFKHLIQLPFPISTKDIFKLMHLSLDFSYLKFKGEYFYQSRGIQMGNSSSVSIANITVGLAIKDIWKEEIVFKARFLDDILCVVDVTQITDLNTRITNTFKHKYLEFTHESDYNSINFLDLKISLHENNSITTALYKKPVSKHEYLHYKSNHPNHLLKSLPYSCALRIIRTCSNEETRSSELELMFDKFLNRNYPQQILDLCKTKLENINRESLLIPKTRLLIGHLRVNNPDILSYYNVSPPICNNLLPSNKLYIVMPFYKNVVNLKVITLETFRSAILACQNEDLKRIAFELCMQVVFKIPNPLLHSLPP